MVVELLASAWLSSVGSFVLVVFCAVFVDTTAFNRVFEGCNTI